MERNLKCFLIASGISLTGTWIHYVALYWLAYQLFQSAAILGIIALTSGLPILLFTFIGGTLGDKYARKKILICVQLASGLMALILSMIVMIKVTLTVLLLFSAFHGILFALEGPLKQAILPSLINDKSRLAKAISWNVMINHSARILGPFLCAFLLSREKVFFAFLLDSISFFVSATFLFYLNLPAIVGKKSEKAILMARDGIKYALAHKQLLYVILATGIFGFFIGPYTSQIPTLVANYYDLLNYQLTLFYSATGIGGLLAALVLRFSITPKYTLMIYSVGFIIATSSLSTFFYGQHISYGMCMLFLTSFGMVLVSATSTLFLQEKVAEAYRGRIMSLHQLLFVGLAPFSNAVLGGLCEMMQPKNAFILGAFVSILSLMVFLFMMRKRQPIGVY